jgi:ubiquinone/menaquinone biosynthesis C-methylase UbiE
MSTGKLLHHHTEHADSGRTLNHPRAYEIVSAIAFAGARRYTFTRLAALAKPRAGDRILDVGCGTGYLTRVLAPVVTPAGQVTGLDPSPAMIEYALGRAPGNCDYTVGRGQDLPFPDGSFDTVVSSLALHHIPADDRREAVREMFRVLRPGGRLLVADLRPPANALVRRLGELLLRHHGQDVLGTLVPDTGFRVEAEGELPPRLRYVQAVRPEKSSAV